jgi:hypothetical protein
MVVEGLFLVNFHDRRTNERIKYGTPVRHQSQSRSTKMRKLKYFFYWIDWLTKSN